MPINDSTEDTFHYGIEKPVDALDCICERIDKTYDPGDLVDRIKRKIEDSSVVIADLTGQNASVFLEVGYAWGRQKPTMLLVQEADISSLPFDVKTQTCITYKSIRSAIE
jgi:hypothetical protein